ncbi:hypothetical protein A4G23_05378 [Streptomyces rubrolavendulae]|uniref:Uncharacterized protein n=2 Tax=Streptomyces rubrolavendulae TaxID=285473 RepID=A0A1D8GAL6_9ACTN|nr:hypothetical protein A4G23_05378 [Streptomyces rubrolavendulae]
MPLPKALRMRPAVPGAATAVRPAAAGSARGSVTAAGAPSNAAVVAALVGGAGSAAPPPLSVRAGSAAAQDTVGNGAVAAAGAGVGPARETGGTGGRSRPDAGRGVAEEGAGGRTGAAREGSTPARGRALESETRDSVSGGPGSQGGAGGGASGGGRAEKAAGRKRRGGPRTDPKFAALTRDVRSKKRALAASHPPPRAEAVAAQDAALPPRDDLEAQGKAANAERMHEAEPREFDQAAFIRAVEKAVADRAPKNLDEADRFAGSGKADEVRAEVHGKVGEGRADSARQIATTTAAPPDTSAAVPKKVVPMRGDRPPGAPAAPDPAQAVPDRLPPSETDMSAGPAEVDRRMADARVTEAQLRTSNEPAFTRALGAKRAAERHSAAAPRRLRGHEAAELRGGTARARRIGTEAMGAMGDRRALAGRQVDAGKAGAKGSDEEKRAAVTAVLQGVFDRMKKDVEAILDGLDGLVDDRFDRGEREARKAFTAEHRRKMDEYKDRRYAGATGKLRWVRDLFAGLPAEADRIFEEARDGYVRRMRQVITDVAGLIGAELNRAKRRIAQGRAEMRDAVRRLPADLREVGRRAVAEFTDRFDELTRAVDEKGTQLVDTLAAKYTEALTAVDDEIAAEKEKNRGLVAKAVDAVKAVIDTVLELKRLLLAVLAKAAQAVMLILRDPVGFLRNLVSAVGAGLRRFLQNIGRHLKQGILSWLLGRTAEAGIRPPARFDTPGVVEMVAGTLGLTWHGIRARLTRKVPEPAVAAAESAVPLLADVRRRGVAALWEEIRPRVGDLRARLLDDVVAYVRPTIVVAGILWVISLLNPASAFVRAVKLIVDFVRFVVTQARQIIAFVNAVLDAVIAIARGGSGGVPALVERALARSIPVLLGVLAALLGVGGVAARVGRIVRRLAAPVDRAVNAAVDRLAGLVRRLWARIGPGGGGKGSRTRAGDAAGAGRPRHPDRPRGRPGTARRPGPAGRPGPGRGPRRDRDPGTGRDRTGRDRDRRGRPGRGRRRDEPTRGGGRRDGRGREDRRTRREMLAALDAAVREAEALLGADAATEESVRRGLPAIRRRHRLTRITLERSGPHTYHVTASVNPSRRTSYRTLFPYRIGKAAGSFPTTRHPHSVVQLRAVLVPFATGSGDRWTGFVVTMAATPGEILKRRDVATRYLDEAWNDTDGSRNTGDLAAARTAVVIGVNTFERLDPQKGDPVRDAVDAVGRRPELLLAVFGFHWTPRWVKDVDGTPVGIDEVRAAYRGLRRERDRRRAEANERKLRDKGALPYGVFREEVLGSSYTRRAVELLQQVNRQVHVVGQDADTGVAAISGKGVLKAYEDVLSGMARHPLLTIGGYHFEGADWGRRGDRRTRQLTRLANRLDRAIREAIARRYPEMLYPTEPNMLVKAWDRDHADGIFQNARMLARLQVQGDVYGIGGAEGRELRERLRKVFGPDFSVRYAPEASTATSAEPGDEARGLAVTPAAVRRARRGRMLMRGREEAVRVRHRMYALIIQSQTTASAQTLAREFSRAARLGPTAQRELASLVFVHVENVAMLMSDDPRLTARSPVVRAELKRLEESVAGLLETGSGRNKERYRQGVAQAQEITREIVYAMTAPELAGLWRRVRHALDEVTRKPRRGGGRR